MTPEIRAGPRGGAAGSEEITKFSGFGPHKLPQAENQIASRNPRLRHLAARIHELGERPLYELFLELERGADLHDTLERYARLSPLAEFIAALGGDRFAKPRVVVDAVLSARAKPKPKAGREVAEASWTAP